MTFNARGKADSSPVVCDGKIVFGVENGRIFPVQSVETASHCGRMTPASNGVLRCFQWQSAYAEDGNV